MLLQDLLSLNAILVGGSLFSLAEYSFDDRGEWNVFLLVLINEFVLIMEQFHSSFAWSA